MTKTYPSWEALNDDVGPQHPSQISCDGTLIWYDGPIVSLGRIAGDETAYLAVQVDENRVGDDFPYAMTVVSHHLGFDSNEDAVATLHEGTIPTMETYDKAKRIRRLVHRWRLLAPGKGEEHSVEIEDIERAAIDPEELPDVHLKPSPTLQR